MDYRDRSKRIARGNDLFRTTLNPMQGVLALSEAFLGRMGASGDVVMETLRAIARDESFPRERDPYGEHDLGVVVVRGVRIVWKICYYSDNTMQLTSRDPSDPLVTYRRLSVMLEDEYEV